MSVGLSRGIPAPTSLQGFCGRNGLEEPAHTRTCLRCGRATSEVRVCPACWTLLPSVEPVTEARS